MGGAHTLPYPIVGIRFEDPVCLWIEDCPTIGGMSSKMEKLWAARIEAWQASAWEDGESRPFRPYDLSWKSVFHGHVRVGRAR